jgi:hypothetical protein
LYYFEELLDATTWLIPGGVLTNKFVLHKSL